MNKPTFGLMFSFLLFAPAFCAASTASDYRDMGSALFQKGLYPKAADYFKQAVQADPNDWQSYEDLGNTYMKMGDNADALDAYQKCLQINPDDSKAQTQVDSLKASGTASQGQDQSNFNSLAQDHPAVSSSNGSQWEESQPITVSQPSSSSQPPAASQPSDNNATETVVIQRKRPWRRIQPQNYNDGLAPMDHAKFWSSLQIGYTYAQLGDLSSSAGNINNNNYVNPDPGLPISYNGNSTFSNSGLHLGAQFGFLLNPYMGIALGAKYIGMADYTANVAYNDATSDTEAETLSPSVVPITLDYFLFLPDSGGRFFISGGVGYYVGVVHVDETYSYSNFYNQNESSQPENWVGDLYSGTVGFQVGIGREFAISRQFGIELYAQGRYAKITNYRGTVYDQYGNAQTVGLTNGTTNGVAEIDNPAYINSASGERNTTLDFTGFDVGFAMNFYSF